MNSVYSIETLIAEGTGLIPRKHDNNIQSIKENYSFEDNVRDIQNFESLETLQKLNEFHDCQKIKMLNKLKQVYCGNAIEHFGAKLSIENYIDNELRSIEAKKENIFKRFWNYIKQLIANIINVGKHIVYGLILTFTKKMKDKSRNRTFTKDEIKAKFNKIGEALGGGADNGGYILWHLNANAVENVCANFEKNTKKAITDIKKCSKPNITKEQKIKIMHNAFSTRLMPDIEASAKIEYFNLFVKRFLNQEPIFALHENLFGTVIKSFSHENVKRVNSATEKLISHLNALMKEFNNLISIIENDADFEEGDNQNSESVKKFHAVIKDMVVSINKCVVNMTTFIKFNITVASILDE